MEYIANELCRNGANLNKEMLKDQLNKIKEKYGERYQELIHRVDAENLIEVFHAVNINSDGRILSYLLLLYYERQRGVNVEEPLRLVANVMRLNFEKRKKKTLCQRLLPYLCSVIVCMFTHDFVKSCK